MQPVSLLLFNDYSNLRIAVLTTNKAQPGDARGANAVSERPLDG